MFAQCCASWPPGSVRRSDTTISKTRPLLSVTGGSSAETDRQRAISVQVRGGFGGASEGPREPGGGAFDAVWVSLSGLSSCELRTGGEERAGRGKGISPGGTGRHGGPCHFGVWGDL